MGNKTSIGWTEATWNPIRGCSRISAGCGGPGGQGGCYAEGIAARFSGPGQAYEGLAKMTPAGPRWTGKIKLIEKHLEDPIRWKKPRMIFVNSMSDMFHEKLEWDQIKRIFEVMLKAPQHTYQILTKRHDIMKAFMEKWVDFTCWPQSGRPVGGEVPSHIWLGVSVEDQKAADLRINDLLDTPAAVRFLSVEPMIGPVDLRQFLMDGHECALSWVICGGESGNKPRPMKEEWAGTIIRQCKEEKVPFFMKQMGTAWAKEHSAKSHKGEDPKEWPEWMRIQEFPKVEVAG